MDCFRYGHELHCWQPGTSFVSSKGFLLVSRLVISPREADVILFQVILALVCVLTSMGSAPIPTAVCMTIRQSFFRFYECCLDLISSLVCLWVEIMVTTVVLQADFIVSYLARDLPCGSWCWKLPTFPSMVFWGFSLPSNGWWTGIYVQWTR